MDIPFIPGWPAPKAGPLSRFLPPLADGVAAHHVERHTRPGGLVLDPFGASPLVAVEAALLGRAALVTAHNPIARSMLQLAALSPQPATLRGVLARLADAPKDGQRLEHHLRELYASECNECGAPVEADAFVWRRGEPAPASKLYYCPSCGRLYEHPVTDADVERARRFQRKGLHYSIALERVAGLNDPDRVHAEEALEVYPPRAVYALMTLLNKFERLARPSDRAPGEALMLSAFDAGDGLRGHPESRPRPRQLTLPPRYLELNLWRALERAPGEWSQDDSPIPTMTWTGAEAIPPGVIALFDGPIRELAPRLKSSSTPPVDLILTTLPRPNQPFWTLSALWAGWLWGREAAAPFKGVLRRRRYDWAWHAEALESAARALAPHIPAGRRVIGLMPEAEPGFVAAAMAGFDRAGFQLIGRALRADLGEAQLDWEHRPRVPLPLASADYKSVLRQSCAEAARETLRRRGEPSRWESLHLAAWSELVKRMPLAAAPVPPESNPVAFVGAEMEAAVADGMGFVRFGVGDRPSAPEVGSWWLELDSEPGLNPPLADRVESEVLRLLSEAGPLSEADLDLAVCRTFPGLLTPGARLVRACLSSYGTDAPPGEALRSWRLRDEDRPEARARERESVQAALIELGERLGYRAEGGAILEWRADGGAQFRFYVITSASFGHILLNPDHDPTCSIVVLPGGRASLVEFKLKRDPRLRSAFELGWHFLKFRHVRWLASDSLITREAFLARLDLDPLGKSEAQMPLL